MYLQRKYWRLPRDTEKILYYPQVDTYIIFPEIKYKIAMFSNNNNKKWHAMIIHKTQDLRVDEGFKI